MKPILLLIFFFPGFCEAQSKLTGLASYQIGITTPDSLGQAFREQDQSYVKGTIALPCAHIRLFKASTVTTGGLALTNLVLAFYDNRLFKLFCDYSPLLDEFVRANYGKSVSLPNRRSLRCTQRVNDPLELRGKCWSTADVVAFVVHINGYNSDCQPQKITKLSISSRRFSALSSDCALNNTDPFIEEFEPLVNDCQPEKQSEKR